MQVVIRVRKRYFSFRKMKDTATEITGNLIENDVE